MIVLFTDFGIEGPYTGQVQARLQQLAPGVPVINLFSDLEPWDVEARGENQLLMCVFQRRTRSWLMVVPLENAVGRVRVCTLGRPSFW